MLSPWHVRTLWPVPEEGREALSVPDSVECTASNYTVSVQRKIQADPDIVQNGASTDLVIVRWKAFADSAMPEWNALADLFVTRICELHADLLVLVLVPTLSLFLLPHLCLTSLSG